jgi:hypothetical protein
LDGGRSGYVSQYKFSEFIQGFGPLSQSIEKMNALFDAKWFHGYISRRESEFLLNSAEPGTFLLRFSESDAKSFAISFKSKNKIFQILVDSCIFATSPSVVYGYQINEDNVTFKKFRTLQEVGKSLYNTI